MYVVNVHCITSFFCKILQSRITKIDTSFDQMYLIDTSFDQMYLIDTSFDQMYLIADRFNQRENNCPIKVIVLLRSVQSK